MLWLPSTHCMVHGHNDDEVQAFPHAGTLGLLFLATRAESRSLCVGIALILQGMHRQASSASWHVLLSHRLEPKLRCMRSICYRRQGSRSDTCRRSQANRLRPAQLQARPHADVPWRPEPPNERDAACSSPTSSSTGSTRSHAHLRTGKVELMRLKDQPVFSPGHHNLAAGGS